jgi:hypothetical protein
MFIKKCLLFSAFLLVAGQAFGQAARSPFSSFGLGEQYGLASAVDQGMGGVGISNMHYWNINNQNAALLVHNRYTSFQAGMIGEQRTQVSTLASERSGSGNLNYVTIAIPVVNGKWTTSFNLMPYTKLNYRLTYRQQVAGDTAHVQVTEEGSGGINQFGWSNGVKINKWASVGLRSTYLFSSVSNLYSNEIQASGQVLVITPYVYERTFVSSLKFSPSVSIHIDSITKKNYRLNFGLVYDMAANLNTKFSPTDFMPDPVNTRSVCKSRGSPRTTSATKVKSVCVAVVFAAHLPNTRVCSVPIINIYASPATINGATTRSASARPPPARNIENVFTINEYITNTPPHKPIAPSKSNGQGVCAKSTLFICA